MTNVQQRTQVRSGRMRLRIGVLAMTVLAMLASMLYGPGAATSADAQLDDGQFGVPPVNATYHGVLPYQNAFMGQVQYDAFSYGDIVFYTPPGKVTQEMANQWLAWHATTDDILRTLINDDTRFDAIFREMDPNLGRRMKVLATPSLACGLGCGNKSRAEAVGIIEKAIAEPDNYEHHWLLFYEQARGGADELFDNTAGWPLFNQSLPHVVAALTFYEIGGLEGVQRGVPGDVYRTLDDWVNLSNVSYVDQFADGDQLIFNERYSNGVPIFPPTTSIHLRIAIENGIGTLAQVFESLKHYPRSDWYENATQAMCGFQGAVSTGTGGRYDQVAVNSWRLPANCAIDLPTDRVSSDNLFVPATRMCVDMFKPSARILGMLPCDGSAAQQASLVPVEDDRYLIEVGDGCIESAAENGRPLIGFSCHGELHQQWTIGNGDLRTLDGQRCIEAAANNLWGGGMLMIQNCNGSQAQQFSLAGLPVQLTCQGISNSRGTDHGVTWGTATAEEQAWWSNNGCATSPSSAGGALTCQGISDSRGTHNNVTWGSATAEEQAWWISNGCTTSPSSAGGALTCQGISDSRGTDHGVTWGSATAEEQAWWISNGCATSPSSAGGALTCQGISDSRGTEHNVTWGTATTEEQAWWINNGCATSPS